jgi:hypothetical protein
MMFTTNDRDNDEKSDKNCATTQQGAWWYKSCGYSDLNGIYFPKVKSPGIRWYHWKNAWKTFMTKIEMKIRPS